MKKILIAVLALAMMVNLAAARRGAKKAGEITDGVYYDRTYDFSLEIPEDVWNTSIKKDKDRVRLILTKDQYDIPIHFTHAPNYTQVPRITVYIDTLPMDLRMYVDSLLSDEYKSDQKNKIIEEFDLLFGDYNPRSMTKVKVADAEGYFTMGERQYTMTVAKAGSEADRGDVVTEYYGGGIYFFEHDNHVYMFHFICENLYASVEIQDFTKLMEGFAFVDDDDGEEKEAGDGDDDDDDEDDDDQEDSQ